LFGELPICISLGDACGPVLMLRDLKIRTEAFPFDWIQSPFDAFYKALVSDFAFFLTDLTMRPDKQGVIDHYGFNFTHDWPTIHDPHINPLTSDFIGNCQLFNEWEKALPLVREKYHRRIERLKQMCLGRNKIIFIRSGSFSRPKEEALMIRDFFSKKYPTLEFLLVVLSSQENFKTEWNIDHIKNFYLKKWHDPAGLAKILQKVDPVFNNLPTKGMAITSSEFDMMCETCLSMGIKRELC
jgi:hypothetical protein